MTDLAPQLRYAVRRLRSTPGVAAMAILALALGIGLTTTMFSVVYGVLLRGLPYPNAERIAIVYRNNAARGLRRQPLTVYDFRQYRRQQRSFAEFGAYTSGTANIRLAENPERADVAWITANVFSILGVRPLLGRAISESETLPGAAPVAVLSYRTWRERFNGRASAVGESIRVGGVAHTIVGVMPDGLNFPAVQSVWLPLSSPSSLDSTTLNAFVVTIGLLRRGVSRTSATSDIATIARRLAADHPERDKGFDATVSTFTDWSIGPQPRRLLVTMLGAVFCVLLVACANVMNLLSDRAISRSRDVGIRTALGATRGVVVREILLETAVLCAVGVLVGGALAAVGVAAFNRATVNAGLPPFVQVGLYAPVLAFAVVMGAVAALASGIVPALRASRVDVAEILKDGSRGVSGWRVGRLSKALVVVEAAMSCLLLTSSGLMIESVARIRNLDPGFRTRDVFIASLDLPASPRDRTAWHLALRRVEDALTVVPAASAVSLSSGLPGAAMGLGSERIVLDGAGTRSTDVLTVDAAAVSTGFFGTLGIPLDRGRLFDANDRDGAPAVAIVTRHFARVVFGDRDPLGQRVMIKRGVAEASAETEALTVVGIIPDIWGGDPEDPRPAILFRPLMQALASQLAIAIRAHGNPLAMTAPVRKAIRDVAPDAPLNDSGTLADSIAQQLWFVRLFGTMFMIFGFVALFLGTVGLYAVTAFATARRTREMGIRIALGARRATILQMVLRQGMVQLGLGIAVGLGLAALATPLLSALLVGVDAHDPVVFGGVAAALLVAGLLACLRPAHSATRADPMAALRQE